MSGCSEKRREQNADSQQHPSPSTQSHLILATYVHGGGRSKHTAAAAAFIFSGFQVLGLSETKERRLVRGVVTLVTQRNDGVLVTCDGIIV